MAESLAFAGYDYQFIYGHGFHSGKHGMAMLPDSLRWLWCVHESYRRVATIHRGIQQ